MGNPQASGEFQQGPATEESIVIDSARNGFPNPSVRMSNAMHIYFQSEGNGYWITPFWQ